jgi:D-alanyl-D-alanine carboxypeptidase
LVLRARVNRFVFLSLSVTLLAVALCLGAAPVVAKTDSYIVIDAASGKTLTESNADAPAHPASLTKMMTLYLLFSALEHGKVTLDQPFTISRWAASQAPSKLGLIPGQTITVGDLILGIVTHSANDAAVTIAENLGGSEPAFAREMTEKARELGMMHTVYVNASGLPNPGQLTTAHDLAILARALYRDFPKEYHYFATERFTYRGVTYDSHNHLMASFPGMDGIKTGYIHASGFNLAASAVRNDRRLIGIVLGGDTAHARDIEMAYLLNAAFAGQYGAPAVLTAQAQEKAPPNTLSRRAVQTLAALSPVARAEAATAHRVHPLRYASLRREPHGGWNIQVGAYARQDAATKAGTLALAKLSEPGHPMRVLPPARHERYYRARLVDFSERDAVNACRLLHQRHVQCAVIAPGPAQRIAATVSHRG